MSKPMRASHYFRVCMCFPRKSPCDVTSVIDAREVTFPRSSIICTCVCVYVCARGTFGCTSLSKVDWIRHSSACNGIVITYATYMCVCVCVLYVRACASTRILLCVQWCATAMAASAVIVAAATADGSHKVSRKTIHYYNTIIAIIRKYSWYRSGMEDTHSATIVYSPR